MIAYWLLATCRLHMRQGCVGMLAVWRLQQDLRALSAGLVAAAVLTRLTRLQCRLDHTLSAARSDDGWTQLLGALPELRYLHMSFDQARALPVR